jgi:hypothetical protein
MHACMRCTTGIELHACVYELASYPKGADGSQIYQSGATMPDRLAAMLAANRLASATFIVFALQNSFCTFCYRGLALVGGPNCGGVRPYEATPWVTLLIYPNMCGWSVS